jgi:hypothetical protein
VPREKRRQSKARLPPKVQNNFFCTELGVGLGFLNLTVRKPFIKFFLTIEIFVLLEMEETDDIGLGIKIRSVNDSEDLHPNNQDPEDSRVEPHSATKNDENAGILNEDERATISKGVHQVVQQNPPSIVVKFEPIWMIKKIYEWDQFLGGQIVTIFP